MTEYTRQELICIQKQHNLNLKQCFLFQKLVKEYAGKITKEQVLQNYCRLGYDSKLLAEELNVKYDSNQADRKEKFAKEDNKPALQEEKPAKQEEKPLEQQENMTEISSELGSEKFNKLHTMTEQTHSQLLSIYQKHKLSLNQLFHYNRLANEYTGKVTKEEVLEIYRKLAYDPKLLEKDLKAKYGHEENLKKESGNQEEKQTKPTKPTCDLPFGKAKVEKQKE